MKIYLIFIKLILVAIVVLNSLLVIAQEKSIVVVYDDSGSMDSGQNSKCSSVSYATQVLTAFLSNEDDFYVVKMSSPEKVLKIDLNNRQQAIKDIESWSCVGSTPMSSIITGINQLVNISNKEKYLFIFTDGEISGYSGDKKSKLINFIKSDNTKVLLLNINISQGEFAESLKSIGVADILNASSNNSDIIRCMEKISSGIMTLPETGLPPTAITSNNVTLTSEFPLKKVIVLEQTTNDNLNLITSSSIGNKQLDISESYFVKKDNLESRITHITSNSKKEVIEEGNIIINFSKNINISNVKFLPLVALNLETEINGCFKSRQGNTIVVCEDNNKVTFTAKIVDNNGKTIKPDLLSQAKITLHIDGNEFKMIFEDTVYKYDIQVNKSITVSISAKHEGYYFFKSNLYYISLGKCPIISLPDTIDYPVFNVTEISNDGGVYIQPLIDGKPISYKDFSNLKLKLIVKSDADVELIQDSTGWKLICLHKSNPCFAKTGQFPVEIELWSESQNRILDKKNFIITVKNECFLIKCLALILWIIGLLLAIIYLWGIIKKPRFNKDYNFFTITQHSKSNIDKRPERIKTNFFTKWFIPYRPESFNLDGLIFKAGRRKSYAILSKKSGNNITSEDKLHYDSMPISLHKDIRISERVPLTLDYGSGKTTYHYIKKTENNNYY